MERCTVVDEQGDVGVGGEVGHLLAGRVGGHDDDGRSGVWRGGQVGVVHEGDVRGVVCTGGQVQEAGVLEALHDFVRQRRRHAHVGVAGRGLVAEGYLLLHGGVVCALFVVRCQFWCQSWGWVVGMGIGMQWCRSGDACPGRASMFVQSLPRTDG